MRVWAYPVLGALVASAGTIWAADVADPAKAEEGKTAFRAGVNLLQDPDGAKYEEAMPQFRRAYELLKNWKVLGNLGICALKLERDGEAVEAFEKYLSGGGKDLDKDERAQVERDLATLKAQVVKVQLEFPTAGATVTDERVNVRGDRIVNDYRATDKSLKVGMHPGHHVLVMHLPGGEARWEADMNPGGTVSHQFEIAAAAPTPVAEAKPSSSPAPSPGEPEHLSRPVPSTVFIAGGATVALALGATVTGVMALSKRSDFNAANGQPGKSSVELQDLHNSAATMGIVNTVLTGAAVVGAGVTAYLFLSRPEVRETHAEPAVRVSPFYTAGGGGLWVTGQL